MEQPMYYTRKPNVGGVKFESDPLNSTYRWEIYLTPGHERNKISLLDGYSKGMGYENTNKVVLLYRKLINPLLPYLSRCDTIIIYEQEPGLPKEMHPMVLELFSNHYRAYGWVANDMFINDFLKTYYTNYVKTGVMPPVEDRRKNARKSVYMAELDHSKYQFKTQQELKDFCRARVEKYSETCMRGWYYRHADFQPELFSNDVSDALMHQVNSAPTVEAARSALDALQEKYSKRL